MNAKNTAALYSSFPKIFNSKLPWGFEFDDGWYELVKHLCQELQSHIDKTHDTQVVCIQAKEKFGTLRFYVDNTSNATQSIIDKYCKLSSTTCEVTGGIGSVCKKGDWLKTLCPESAILLGYESLPQKGS